MSAVCFSPLFLCVYYCYCTHKDTTHFHRFHLWRNTLPPDQWNCHWHSYGSSYANLFMVKLEESFLYTGTTLKLYVWWHYIDIFVIWQHGEPSLKQFVKDLNSWYPSIKFTAQWSSQFHPIPGHTCPPAAWLTFSVTIHLIFCSK